MEFGSSPLSTLTILVLYLPGVLFVGRAVARWLGGSADVRSVLAPGLAISIWLLSVHIVGLVSRSFRIGFMGGTFCVAMVGVWVWAAERRARLSKLPLARLRIPRWYWIGALSSTCLMAPMFWGWCMHDEVIFVGHLSIPSQILNGIYPPRYTSMPTVPLRYHYGFDLLVACTSIMTRLRVDRAIDVVMTLGFLYTFLLLCVFGRKIIGGHGTLCAFITLFGAGLPMALPDVPLDIATMLGQRKVEELWLDPPLTSYFMQHPWTLGLPIGLCTILVALDSKSPKRRRTLLLVLLLVMLSLSQIALFASIGGALFAREVFRGPRGLMFRRTVNMAAVLVVVVALAFAMGGFFTPLPDSPGIGIVFRLGIVPSLKGNIQWFGCTFGLLLPLGLAGFVFIRRERLFLATLLLGSSAVVLLFHYDKTWDIVKFAAISAMILGVLSSATIAKTAAARPRFLSFPATLLFFAGTTVAGLAQPVIFGANLPGIPPYWSKEPPLLQPEDVPVVTWLRPRIRVGEIVYRNDTHSLLYALWGGLPQAQIYSERAHAVDPRAIADRDNLLNALPAEATLWRKEGFRYFVLSPYDGRLHSLTRAWERKGQAKTVLQSGHLRVVELLD